MPTRPSNDAELGALTLVANRNSSCPRASPVGLDAMCRRTYDGTTDAVSGRPNGPPSSAVEYDPTTRYRQTGRPAAMLQPESEGRTTSDFACSKSYYSLHNT